MDFWIKGGRIGIIGFCVVVGVVGFWFIMVGWVNFGLLLERGKMEMFV